MDLKNNFLENQFVNLNLQKEKEIVKQQLKVKSLSDIKFLIKKVNYLELIIKKNLQASDKILNNFILENLENSNNLI